MNENVIKSIIKLIIAYVLYYSGAIILFLKFFLKKGLYVFNYHNFNTFVNDYWKFGSIYYSNYRENFEHQIRFLNEYLRKIDSFDLKNTIFEYPKYFLSFDDGYKDNFDIALSVLNKYSVPAVFFITTSVIGTDNLLWHDKIRIFYEIKRDNSSLSSTRLKNQCNKDLKNLKRIKYKEFLNDINQIEKFLKNKIRIMMNWNEIEEICSHGFLAGIHTHNHFNLAKLNYNQQKEEIEASIEMFKKKLGTSPEFFAYPEGDNSSYNEYTIDILKSLGIKYSFTTECGVNTNLDSPYRLKRIGVNPSDPVPVLALKIFRAMRVRK